MRTALVGRLTNNNRQNKNIEMPEAVLKAFYEFHNKL
jgi:hypothetical protein